MNRDLINYLSQFLTEQRLATLKANVVNRTRYLTVVLENIYQPQNASAVLRTCDCLGVQDVHIIEDQHPYRLNPKVELGSAKWLNINTYPISETENSTRSTLLKLKAEGYRLVATSPGQNNVSLNDFELEKGKTALLFGTELTGLSPTALEMADERLTIPMYGFTESFNISVSAAIVLYHLCREMRTNSRVPWQLTAEAQDELLLQWLRRSIKNVSRIEKVYRERVKKK